MDPGDQPSHCFCGNTVIYASSPPASQPTDVTSTGEPEKPKSQEKPREDLKTAQATTDKLQLVIESSMACLLEQQLSYPLNKTGIIEAYLPQKKIETICGVSTIGSLLISGLSYLQIHGLPSSSPESLLRQCKSQNPIQFSQGALNNMADLGSLNPTHGRRR